MHAVVAARRLPSAPKSKGARSSLTLHTAGLPCSSREASRVSFLCTREGSSRPLQESFGGAKWRSRAHRMNSPDSQARERKRCPVQSWHPHQGTPRHVKARQGTPRHHAKPRIATASLSLACPTFWDVTGRAAQPQRHRRKHQGQRLRRHPQRRRRRRLLLLLMRRQRQYGAGEVRRRHSGYIQASARQRTAVAAAAAAGEGADAVVLQRLGACQAAQLLRQRARTSKLPEKRHQCRSASHSLRNEVLQEWTAETE